MLLEILFSALAAAALLGLLWLLLAQLLLPIRAKDACLVLFGRSDGDDLEQNCRGYLLLRHIGALDAPLFLIDDGLSAEGRKLAMQLTELDESIRFCPPDPLQTQLSQSSHP